MWAAYPLCFRNRLVINMHAIIRHGGGGPFWGLKSTQPLDSALQQLSFANLGPRRQLTLQNECSPHWPCESGTLGLDSESLGPACLMTLPNLADVVGFAPWHKQAVAAIEPVVLYQIMKRALEVLNQGCGGHWLQNYGNPLAKTNRLLKHNRQWCCIILQVYKYTWEECWDNNVKSVQSRCKPQERKRRVTQLQSGPKAHACEPSCCEDSCAPFLPGHENTWPPCQTTACAALSCAIYANHALLNVKVSNSMHTNSCPKSPRAGWANIPSDHLPASLSLACLPVKKGGQKSFQEKMPATIGPTYRHTLSWTYRITAPSRIMKEQGASRACKDDWAQNVGNDLLPETLSHPEGLSGEQSA